MGNIFFPLFAMILIVVQKINTMKEYIDIAEILLQRYGWNCIFFLIILFVIFNPDKTKELVSWIWYPLGGIFKFARKRYIKFQIDGACSRALKNIAKELPEFNIPKFRIKWIKEQNYGEMLEKGEAIVNLKFSHNQTQNIINATSVYVHDIFLKQTKPYISENLKEAIDLSIIKNILLKISPNRNIMSDFLEDNQEKFAQYINECDKLEQIDDAGLFSRILIRELDSFGNKLIGRIPNQAYQDEADKFTEYLYNISVRDIDENTKLQFEQPTIKVGVLLVAKSETYYNYGLAPYLRRIKLGFARGIDTFYLLAREDKVDILRKVVSELLGTGNFQIINKPQNYRDRQNRTAICYCIRIDADSALSKSYQDIKDGINNLEELCAVVTYVRQDKIIVDLNGVEGFISSHNFSKNNEKINPLDYFRENTLINVRPLEINSDGVVEFTLIDTSSDPFNILHSNFSIGKIIDAKVTYVDDEFVKFEIPNSLTTAIAFRRDLTYSRFMLLHSKFTIGSMWSCMIKEIDYNTNELHLRLSDLKDPWRNQDFKQDSVVNFTICKREKNLFIGEISEGITGILRYNYLSWKNADIEGMKHEFLLGHTYPCKIINIDYSNEVIYLSHRGNQNPYDIYCSEHKGREIECIFNSKDEKGWYGLTDNKLSIFMPKGETCRGDKTYKLYLNTKQKVYVKDIGKRLDSIIVSVKPYIPYPLQDFYDSHSINQRLYNLKISDVSPECIKFKINNSKQSHEAILFKNEISSLLFINDCRDLFQVGDIMPLLCIKEINLEKNSILLSLKQILQENAPSLSEASYDVSYEALVLGRKYGNNYIVVIKDLWVEAILESHNLLQSGDIVRVRAIRLSPPAEFILD